jgi:hypothetical protein
MENKYNVIILPASGGIIAQTVPGDDGPNFEDIKEMLGINIIEITGATMGGKDYDLYFDEEGRLSNKAIINDSATVFFLAWLAKEGRMTMIPNVVGNAALVEREPCNVKS